MGGGSLSFDSLVSVLDLNVIPSLDVRVEVKQKTLDLDLATTKHV